MYAKVFKKTRWKYLTRTPDQRTEKMTWTSSTTRTRESISVSQQCFMENRSHLIFCWFYKKWLILVAAWRQSLGEALLCPTQHFWVRMNILQQLQTTYKTVEGLGGWQAVMEVAHTGELLVEHPGDLFQTWHFAASCSSDLERTAIATDRICRWLWDRQGTDDPRQRRWLGS